MKERQIVISHYQRELSWIDQFKELYDVIIYTKGDKQLEHSNVITLPNIGREPQTYISHIIMNYDNLAEQTIFLQDKPVDSLTMKSFDILHKPIPLNELVGLGSVLQCDLNGAPHHPPQHPIPVDKLWRHLFKETPPPPQITFIAGAQFAVPKQNILNRSLEFWQHANELLQENPIGTPVCNPPWPWCYERLFRYIFEGNAK